MLPFQSGATASSGSGLGDLTPRHRPLFIRTRQRQTPRGSDDVYEGCQDRIGEDPRAMPPRNDLHTCTLVPRIGKRKTVTVATTVKKGDCLWGISRQLTGTGTNWKDIVNENRQYFKKAKFDTPIDDDLFIIQPGWKLKMPVTAPPPPED
ncbi:unnamed protein product [Closterium sp. Naga37s-1]|nr:unnamed protein product [Closterium sp. Naga37s-1]